VQRRARTWLICGIALAALSVGAAAASSGPTVLSIPGLTARKLEVGGVGRLSDGGALIAGSASDRARSPAWQPVVVRLLVDGSIDLGYGTQGIARPRIGADRSATSMAVDSGSGNGWVGITGRAGGGAILALNRTGQRLRRFGRDGILDLGPAAPPVALAWLSGRLLVAAGTAPCAGCRLALINSSTGKAVGRGELTPAQLSGTATCTGGSVTSAVLIGSRTVEVAFRGSGTCVGGLATVMIPDGAIHGAVRVTRTLSLGVSSRASRELIASSGSHICAAASTPTATILGPVAIRRHLFTGSTAQAGRLVSLVALGPGACAALITSPRHRGGLVLQASVQRPRASQDFLPGSVTPLGMFRCHAHLVAIGSRVSTGGRGGVVVVVPVRRGGRAQVATAARTKRCS
jgi:hypothetical protein